MYIHYVYNTSHTLHMYIHYVYTLYHAHITFVFHLGLRLPFLKLKLPKPTPPVERRFFFPKETKQVLEAVYSIHPHPNSSYIRKLSKNLNVNPLQLFRWFSRRRSKVKLGGKFL